MRRSLAAAVLGISLWLGSLAWSGFVMTRTVLDPDRSEDVADALLEDEAVRQQLEANIAGSVASALPPGAPVDRAALDAGAEAALDSPAVELLFRDALVRTHQAFLGEGDAPRSIDGGAFGSGARDAVVAERPELDGVLPDAPSVEVPLPTERLPNLGPVRRGLLTAVPVLALAAAIGVALALVVTTDRRRVVRRAGFWAIGLGAFVLVFAFGIPALAERFAPDQAQIVAALVAALAASTKGPALALAGVGATAVLLSLVWRRTAAAAPPPAPAPAPGAVASTVDRRARRSRQPRRDLPTPGRRPVPSAAPAGPPRRSPVPDADRTSVWAPAPGADRTRVEAPEPRGPREGTRWVPGTGWVHDGSGPIPDGARWVPGVGYVVEEG